ncbi:DNA replication factor C, large subunit [Xylona heveae TC161]|uniref:Replication factor C subunit 1 n=1 Tax=Xylona heveae (strain CBS 132557 / TC161) TaxID=1328760 RepID=A0A165A607_XYLHT|nr:DNA replication factor C, large subunit [Xylona heveae TC161]KZF20000.1 DNA replication factor C, large subunit [Xylona heveae TC161]
MPADIRSFFGPKTGSQPSSQEKATPKATPKADANASKKKGRGSRRVVDDSDDDAPAPTKSTPKKATPKKPVKQESPKGTETTTSDYFASTGKSKPARSSTKTKAQNAKAATPEPDAPAVKKESPAKNTRSAKSTAKKPTTSYKDVRSHEDDDVPQDEDDADDVFKAEFKSRGKGLGDDYQEEDDEDEEDIKPKRRSAGRGQQTSIGKFKIPDEDVDMKDVNPDDDFVVPDADEEIVEDKPARSSRSSGKGGKRKSVTAKEDEDFVEEDEDDVAPANKRRKVAEKPDRSPAKKSPAKKPRTSAAKKEEPAEDSAVQKIFDSIPTVRPPSPPAKSGEGKKFNYFEHAHSRGQAAPAAGTKEIPIGAENCLAGLTFVFTGLLESLGRDEGQELVKRYGGKVTLTPSSKTSYVVLGADAGPKKLETIKKHNLKTINEDGLFELIRKLPANGGDSKAAEKSEEKRRKEEEKVREMAAEMERQERRAGGAGGSRGTTAPKAGGANAGGAGKAAGASSQKTHVDSRLWTVKYSPQSMQQICGNKGQVERLGRWLKKWHYNAKFNFKKPGPDGSGLYRAVIISGPPGIGKTTAAHLVARLEGFDVVESNASDTRSKKLVESGLRGVLDTSSLLGYFAGEGQKVEASKKKLVLIMDEVDGMSAGDRGGVGALASVCKKTNIPMILICNERKIPKMKPFDYVTLDMPFRRPTTQDIRSRVMTICFREGMKMPGPVVDALIEGSHSDIRQIINMLSTAKLDQEAMDFDQGKAMSKAWQKHVILKPWDITAKLLGGHLWAANSGSTLNEKIELYFNDHEFSYLMLQENYLKTTPTLTNNYSGKERNLKHLELIEKASESISDGDLVDRLIHGPQQQWSLMPTHAVFSTVRPASFVSGNLAGHGPINFTSWLGNNSKQGKLSRFIKEIQGHMRLRAHGDRHEIRQQYLPTLWDQLIRRLQDEGKESIEDIIQLMDSYFLTKEDWDAIMELGLGPMDQEKVKIETQTKSAFTRAYNATSHPLPFMKASSVIAPKKATKEKPDLEEALEESDEGEEILSDNEVKQGDNDEEEDLDLTKDKYVKMPKKKKTAAAGTSAGKKKAAGTTKSMATSKSSSSKSKPAKGGAGAAKGKRKSKAKDSDLDDDDDDDMDDFVVDDDDDDDAGLDDDDDDEDEEDVKPKKSSRGGKKASAAKGRGRGRK